MLFNSLSYFLFLAITVVLYWRLGTGLRPILLLLASYFFYMSFIPAYGVLIAGLTVANYLLGNLMDSHRSKAKLLLLVGLILNLGTLCYYKYASFLIDSIIDASGFLGWNASIDFNAAQIILPLGISFFAFEFIHYLTDVYKGGQPIRHFIHFSLFAAFFPSQIAGPIKRYQDFWSQLKFELPFDQAKLSEGMTLLVRGLFKKIALADNFALIADRGFNAVSSLGTADAWCAALAFTFQIYFDFSGYTDMGRGSALMFGFKLPDNFNLPYIASSMTDFWKRWHISLSTWLRDYLYIPLGGNRCSESRKQANLLITMLLGGLWHGAAWHFVAWGGFHGMALIFNHKYDSLVKNVPVLERFHASILGKGASIVLTLFAVVFGWVLFRANTVADALKVTATMFGAQPSTYLNAAVAQSVLPVAVSVYAIYLLMFDPRFSAWQQRAPGQMKQLGASALSIFSPMGWPARLTLCAATIICAIAFAPPVESPFIYFQF
jgi:alginate O-acetyltransferase complex protein AlgI